MKQELLNGLNRMAVAGAVFATFGLFAAVCMLPSWAGNIGYASVAEPSLPTKPSDGDLPVHTIEKGTKSGIKTPERLSIKEDGEWRTLWRRHRTGSLRSDAAPSVDFDHCMVLAAFQGEGTTNAGMVNIDRVKVLTDKVMVFVNESDTDTPSGGNDKSTSSSFHIVKVGKSTLPVVFN
ncbi:MAG: hypothetical protein SGJ27_13820 [Candidatus Melainabacteria bacterium]|nr:hypothetical protein [Candidatus Melainabacteria bacterium]